MTKELGGLRVGDTVQTVEGESRSAFGADFFDGPGVVSGYRDASKERQLIRVHWVDGQETEALWTALEIVQSNEDVRNPPERWERLKELREKYQSE